MRQKNQTDLKKCFGRDPELKVKNLLVNYTVAGYRGNRRRPVARSLVRRHSEKHERVHGHALLLEMFDHALLLVLQISFSHVLFKIHFISTGACCEAQ